MVTFFEPGNHQVWHQSDKGDWRVAYFDLEEPFTAERLEKRFRETVTNWGRMLEAEGCVPTTKPYLYPHATYVPDDPDAMDRRRFYMAARVKRINPELVPLDLISELTGMGPVDQDQQLVELFEQVAGF